MRVINGRVVMTAVLAAMCATATATQMYTLNTVATFDYTNGGDSQAGLIADSSGNLYGTTDIGGVGNDGTVFEIAAGTHTLSTLTAFNYTNGTVPFSGLVADASGNLYGTTQRIASSSYGTVFEVSAGTHTLTTLAAFSYTNGSDPLGGLIADSSGNLYGTTVAGGTFSSGSGTVYEITANTHAIVTLASFNGTTGAAPKGSLIFDAKGNLYGTTTDGGVNGEGNVFEIAANTHVLTTLFSFGASGGGIPTNGAFPYSGLIFDASGNLYGTTEAGGIGGGTVFKLNPTTSVLTTLFSFNGTDGSEPYAGLIADANGNLFGTTAAGGTDNEGTIFELNPNTDILTTLASSTFLNGYDPMGGLIADASGNLYGTAYAGGADGYGTVFELSPVLVPEPSSLALGLLALGGLVVMVRTKKRTRSAALAQESTCISQ